MRSNLSPRNSPGNFKSILVAKGESAMPDRVELYDGAYENYDSDVYRQVRIETYGVDFGQTSWVTTEESEEIPRTLKLTRDSSVLEIGCGSGMYALHIAQEFGCQRYRFGHQRFGNSQREPIGLERRYGWTGAFRSVRCFQAAAFRR